VDARSRDVFAFELATEIKLDAKPTGVSFKPGAEPSLRLTLAVPCADGKVRVYEASDAMNVGKWRLTSSFEAGKSRCSAISWNPNFFQIPSLLVGCGRSLTIWEFYREQHRWVKAFMLAEHDAVINSVSWAPAMGRSFHLIATGSDRLKIIKLRPQVGEGSTGRFDAVEEKSEESKTPVWSVSWNLTGSILASSDAQGEVTLWKRDFKTWNPLLKASGS